MGEVKVDQGLKYQNEGRSYRKVKYKNRDLKKDKDFKNKTRDLENAFNILSTKTSG